MRLLAQRRWSREQRDRSDRMSEHFCRMSKKNPKSYIKAKKKKKKIFDKKKKYTCTQQSLLHGLQVPASTVGARRDASSCWHQRNMATQRRKRIWCVVWFVLAGIGNLVQHDGHAGGGMFAVGASPHPRLHATLLLAAPVCQCRPLLCALDSATATTGLALRAHSHPYRRARPDGSQPSLPSPTVGLDQTAASHPYWYHRARPV